MGFLCSDSHFTPTQSPSRRCFSVAPHVPSMTKATTAFVAPKDIQFLESKAITNFSRSSAAGCCTFHVLPGIAISRTLSILFRLLTSSVGHSTSPTTGRLFNTIITNRRGITSSHPKIYSTGALTDKKNPSSMKLQKAPKTFKWTLNHFSLRAPFVLLLHHGSIPPTATAGSNNKKLEGDIHSHTAGTTHFSYRFSKPG